MVREGNTTLNDFLRIDRALTAAVEKLSSVSESPRLDAELLLSRALDVRRSFLFAHSDETMDEAANERFQAAVRRRRDGMPLAYITGSKEFWSLDFLVDSSTLVPRPETEVLVDQALRRIPVHKPFKVLDLGTGSGAIAISIAKERPQCKIVATDVSEAALVVGRENARRHEISNVEFWCGNWTDPVADQYFDVIVTNPPYISETDPHLLDLTYEPQLALIAGHDGLDAVRSISSRCFSLLEPAGTLLIEHGSEQDQAVATILDSDGYENIQLVRDLAGLPRVSVALRGSNI